MNKNANKGRFWAIKHSGFTLIELLVVILIIGILAAVALPQYQKAVLKSRFVQLKAMTESLKRAEEVYYLSHGDYTNNFQDLDISIGGTNIVLNNRHPGRKLDWGECFLFIENKVWPGRNNPYATAGCYDKKNLLGYLCHMDGSKGGSEMGVRTCLDMTLNPQSLQHQLCINETGTDTYVEDTNGRDTYYTFFYTR